MDYVSGRIFWHVTLPGLQPALRGAIYDAMNDVIARLHKVDYKAIGLAEFGRECLNQSIFSKRMRMVLTELSGYGSNRDSQVTRRSVS